MFKASLSLLAAFSAAFNNPGMGAAAPGRKARHRGRSYRNDTNNTVFRLINHFMAQNKDVMTRQVHRQLERLRWKASTRVRDRRGERCPYERSPERQTVWVPR